MTAADLVPWHDVVTAWSNPPVDDVGYLPASELLAMDDAEFLAMMEQMRETRYTGWRNTAGRWRSLLHLDDTAGADVLDYGCGVGVEALEYARNGCTVALCDISEANVQVASRLLTLHGFTDHLDIVQLTEQVALPLTAESLDVFHASGVLHHVSNPLPVMIEAYRLLRPSGEVRLLLYSDRGWRTVIGTEPPDDVITDPDFERFVRSFDGVGHYADWYSRDRLEQRFGDLFTVDECDYLTEDDRYLAAVLRPRRVS
jgi:SAM-dependent methyltransferase